QGWADGQAASQAITGGTTMLCSDFRAPRKNDPLPPDAGTWRKNHVYEGISDAPRATGTLMGSIGCLPFAHLVLNFRVPAPPSPRGVLAYATPKRLPFRLKRLAVTEEQIDEWNLPTRPTKRSDSRARNFGSSVSVELDAIDPRRLRSLVERAIRKHMPKKRYDELMAQEERERQQIMKLVDELDIEEPDEARP